MMGVISEQACIHYDALILEVIYFHANQSLGYYHCVAGLGSILQSTHSEQEDHCKKKGMK